MEQTESRINLHDFSHKRKCNSDLVVDRISVLPDSILGVILSFLPTKEAVATVLLSKRWIFLWRTVHNLDFCHESWCDKEDDMKFIEFVNRVLHLHDSGLLYKFSLSWKCPDVSSHTNSWIDTAIAKNVHNLYLCAFNEDVCNVPLSVCRHDSLRSLTVINTVICDSDVCLPRLESLKLDLVHFQNEESCEKLISGCPILKNLSLEIASDDLIDFKCRISSASLRCLEIYFHQISSFKLNAASLENLNLGGRIREIIIESSLSSLVEANLDLSFEDEDEDEDEDEEEEEDEDEDEEEDVEKEGISYNSFVEAIRAFGSAKVLTLTSNANMALERATISPSIEFKRLVKLTSSPCASLQDFICSSDNLEVLEIFELFKRPPKWLTFIEVPRCFSNSLKKVQLYFHPYSEDDLEIIRLVLEHGSRLEVLEIRCYKIEDNCTDVVMLRKRIELTKRILKFPRKSPACRVDITEL